jgi:hypothetical protein
MTVLKEIERERFVIPRTLEQAFGHGARLTVLEERSAIRNAAETLGYVVAGLILGGFVIAPVMLAIGRVLFGRW